MRSDLRDLLVCPTCRGALEWTADDIACAACGARFELADGRIPVLVADDGSKHKEGQMRFFDNEVDEEYETTRPHGTPAFHAWLLEQKFRHAVEGLESLLPGATVLTVCGGSGMDAEFLARAGARVVNSDISLGAARRALERGRRFGVEIASIVADAEHLPFADRSVELVYVHDGLHHLEDPEAGLREMTRVSARAVSVNEPANAAVTAVAVRLGLSDRVEEAGNRVARVEPDLIIRELETRGFRIANLRRYPMLYRHEPKFAVRTLSKPALLPFGQAAMKVLERVGRRFGNKLTVKAVRSEP